MLMTGTLTGQKQGRYSEHIGRNTTQSIFRAFDYAAEIGSPLETYVVINLPTAPGAAADQQFRDIRHKYRDWLANESKKFGRKMTPAYVFTFENPDGHTHVNWVLHVPPPLKKVFEKKLLQWVKKVKGEVGPFDVDVQTITENPKGVAKYIVKGTDPAFVDHFHLRRVHEPQGWFQGQRARVSASLDRAARAAAGFQPRRRSGRHHAWPRDPQAAQCGA
jgi:hypothetical protein